MTPVDSTTFKPRQASNPRPPISHAGAKHGRMAHLLAEDFGHSLEDLPTLNIKAAFGQHAVDAEKWVC